MDKEGGFVNRPPLLDGSNYYYWKSRMSAFLKSFDTKTWKVVLKDWEHPMSLDKDENKTTVLKPECHTPNFHQKLPHQKLKSVDKVQCTKCTTTIYEHASATTFSAFLSPLQGKNNSNVCRHCSFSIGMHLKLFLHRTIIKSGKRSMVKNQSFSQDKLMYRLVSNVSQILYK